MARLAVLLPLALLVVAAGCTTPQPEPEPTTPPMPDISLAFAAPVLIDPARIASEPSIKAGADGSLFVCAPTGTVKYATRPLDLTETATRGAFQSALWYSRDGGATWTFADTAGAAPYRSPMPGAGDCDLAIDAAGTIFMTDQLGLVTEVMSISHDNGVTWEAASALASGLPGVDRQWLWPDPTTPGTVYMVYNHQALGVTVSKTTDDGRTWTATPTDGTDIPPGPIVATNATVAFTHAGGGGVHFVHSEDKGATWNSEEVALDKTTTRDLFTQIVADTEGTLYVAWTEEADEGTSVAYSFSHDAGKTWSPKVVAFTQPGRSLFMWAAAGGEGKLGFSWYTAPDPAGPYFIHAGVVVDADTDHPRMADSRVQPGPVRLDAPCEDGVACTEGRELGDFQMCAVTPDGDLVVAYVNVNGTNAAGQAAGGRITVARMSEGPSLFDEGETFAPWVV